MGRRATEIGRLVEYIAPGISEAGEPIRMRRRGLIVDTRNFFDKYRLVNNWRFLVAPYCPSTVRSTRHTVCLCKPPAWFARHELLFPAGKKSTQTAQLQAWREQWAKKGITGRWYVPRRWDFMWSHTDFNYKKRLKKSEGDGEPKTTKGKGFPNREDV